MNFLKRKCKNYRNAGKCSVSENGFTLIEVLIVLTLISLIGVPLLGVFSNTVNFTGKIKDLTRWNREMFALERVLRHSVSQIKIPFWISDIEVIESIGIIKVPYWNGNASSFLEIEVKDEVFKISTADEVAVFKGYNGFKFDLLEDSQSRTIGLSLIIEKKKKDDLLFQCSFGSFGREVFKEK